MVAPLLALAIPATATIIAALITLGGIMFRNPWVALISSSVVLFSIFPILPTPLKIISPFVLFLWILNMGKGK